MTTPTFDPGLTQQFGGALNRAINKDGSFNVVRRGASWKDVHPYLHLINASWLVFSGVIVLSYLVVNAAFALIYFSLGPDQLAGAEASSEWQRFLNTFYFSAHTLTTVGYGNIVPKGAAANAVSVIEGLCGWLGFAVATGLLFGRVSRPSARIRFSDRALVAPYQDGTGFQFRLVNRRSNNLIQLEARVLLMTVEGEGPQRKRAYRALRLERNQVHFFPLTWTVVHPIDGDSPLHGQTAAGLERLQAEFLILITAYDDTFSQTVHARYSYRYDEVLWGARFTPAFHFSPGGDIELHVDRVGAYETAASAPVKT